MTTLHEDSDLEEEDILIPETLEVFKEIISFQVDKGQGLMRIDKWIQQKIEYVSRQKIQTAIEEGLVLVNHKPCHSNYKIKPADIIELTLIKSRPQTDIMPEDIPLDIVFEDADIIVINKPINMVVHPAVGNTSGTLLNALAGYYKKNAHINVSENLNRLGLVHRIDKNTSGLIVLAKTEQASVYLAKQFFNHTIERKYLAVVWGTPLAPQGIIKTNIARHERFRKQFTNYPYEGEIGKTAITHYKVLKDFHYISFIECELETGRTHQIRVHLKHLGHTLFNDFEYGGDKILKGTIFSKYKQFVDNCFEICPRPALHAHTLGFIHPTTQKDMFFEAELPLDMKTLLAKWEDYCKVKIKG